MDALTPCCDWWPHDADEPCLFNACDCCGGFFSLGPSSSPTCWVCSFAEATLTPEDLAEIDTRQAARTAAWDERPF
jgi:hypothetical protein